MSVIYEWTPAGPLSPCPFRNNAPRLTTTLLKMEREGRGGGQWYTFGKSLMVESRKNPGLCQ